METKKQFVTEDGSIILTSPEDLRAARFDQPPTSSDELRAQRLEIQQQVEEFNNCAKKETSKAGRKKLVRG